MVTVLAPGIQGAEVAGMHGIGVRTPSAAAVALATVGLVGLRHIPKLGILTMGAESNVVATTRLFTVTPWPGMIFKGPGEVPILHCISAYAATKSAISGTIETKLGYVHEKFVGNMCRELGFRRHSIFDGCDESSDVSPAYWERPGGCGAHKRGGHIFKTQSHLGATPW